MREIKTVVVPLDGEKNSERALPLAVRLADRLGVEVRLLSSVTTPEERHFRLDQLRALSGDIFDGPEVVIDVIETVDVASPIEAAAADFGLIVMATSAKLGLHDGHMGSIAERVVRDVKETVMLVGPHAAADLDIDKVVVPVDGSDAAVEALAPAVAWAELLDVPLWVVTVVTPDQQHAAAQAGVHAEHGYVKRLSERVADRVDAEFEVLHGEDPVESLLDFLGGDSLCIMTTTGKSGLRRLVMGSVATGVVRKAAKPVLVVKSSV